MTSQRLLRGLGSRITDFNSGDRVVQIRGSFKGDAGTVVRVVTGRIRVQWDKGVETSIYKTEIRKLI